MEDSRFGTNTKVIILFSNSLGSSDLRVLDIRTIEVGEEDDLKVCWRAVAGVGLKNVIRFAGGFFLLMKRCT